MVEDFFGMEEKQEKYKRSVDYSYHYFPEIGVYVDQTGKVLGSRHKITIAIDNWLRHF